MSKDVDEIANSGNPVQTYMQFVLGVLSLSRPIYVCPNTYIFKVFHTLRIISASYILKRLEDLTMEHNLSNKYTHV